MAIRLPIIIINGTKYFIDNKLKEFRAIDNPYSDVLKMPEHFINNKGERIKINIIEADGPSIELIEEILRTIEFGIPSVAQKLCEDYLKSAGKVEGRE